MKNYYSHLVIAFLILFAGINNQSKACTANYNHTNACAGDTVWFYGLDLLSVHAWDFGDSTYGLANLSFNDTAFHVYTRPGIYYVTHFVNVGAEWDYQTQTITISATCFKADFAIKCADGALYNFVNQSIGQHLTYIWNFGEPSSGNADTSSASNPGHQYASNGNYTVSLIISDGSKSDTTNRTVHVDGNCMSATIVYLTNPCYLDTVHFYYNFSGVNTVYWNFGDTLSGVNNNSTLLSPTHIFSAPGIYTGSVIFSNGISTDTLLVYTHVIDCSVYPGDANDDGVVSGEDIFAIALNYGDTGSVRQNASLNFTAQPCKTWSGLGMYLQAMVDKKHADCNGDGIIDSNDVKAITQNFGKVDARHNNQSEMQLVSPSAPNLKIEYLDIDPEFGKIGKKAILELGDITSKAEGIYGVCTTIKYNDSLIDGNSIDINFSNSWMDTTGNPNLIQWFHNDIAKGLITIVAARTNHLAKSGFGEIAQMNFNLIQQRVGTYPFIFEIQQDAKVMANSMFPSNGSYGFIQNYLRVNIINKQTQIIWEGINDVNENNTVAVFPSPTTDNLNIHSDKNFQQATLKVFDATGRLVMQQKVNGNNSVLNVQAFAEGIYLVEITDGVSVYHNKFMVDK